MFSILINKINGMAVTSENYSVHVCLFSLLKTIKFSKFLFSGKFSSQFLISTVTVLQDFWAFVRTNLYSVCFYDFLRILPQISTWYQSRIRSLKGLKVIH